jgi:hypothetical protein
VYAPAVPCEDVRLSFGPRGRTDEAKLKSLWACIEATVEASSAFARTQSFVGGRTRLCWVPRAIR